MTAVSRKVALWTARLEAHLSTRAFELLCFTMYLCAIALIFIWGAHREFHHVRFTIEPKHPEWRNFKWYIAIARGAGFTLNLNSALVILLASRLLLTFARETPLHKILPLDKSFPAAHIVVGLAIFVGVLIHVPFHFAWLLTFSQFDKFKLWSFSMTVAMGAPLTLVFCMMLITALPYFRKNQFRLFYVTHLLGAALFFPLLLLHGMKRKKPETILWILPPLCIYLIDRVVRWLKTNTSVVRADPASSKTFPGNILLLSVRCPFTYRAGQYAEIQVPAISSEWHPFTIASAPHEPMMSFYIKQSGDWTTKLLSLFERGEFVLRTRGPFGSPAQSVKSYRRVILISGGIGATPFAAIAKDLQYKADQQVSTHGCWDFNETDLEYDDPKVPRRVQHAVDSMYGDSKGNSISLEIADEKGRYITDLLQMTDGGKFAVMKSSVSETKLPLSNSFAGGFGGLHPDNEVDRDISYGSTKSSLSVLDQSRHGDDPEDKNLRATSERRNYRILRLKDKRLHLLSFLHSTRVVLILLISLVLRFMMVGVVGIFELGTIKFSHSNLHPSARSIVLIDAILALLLCSTMTLTIGLEIYFMGFWRFFFRTARCLDFCLFLPLTLSSSGLSFNTFTNGENAGILSALTGVHFAILLPLQFLLLAYRLHRSFQRTLLESHKVCNCRCNTRVPDVDFVWTTKTHNDDEWLRHELPPSNQHLRLHRFVTRDEQVKPTHGIHSTQGRPEWRELFSRIADRTQSGSEVGVFFCGPSPMGDAVRRALRAVEVCTTIRGSYISSLSKQQIRSEFGLSSDRDANRLRRYGCNIRFVFREENF